MGKKIFKKLPAADFSETATGRVNHFGFPINHEALIKKINKITTYIDGDFRRI